jgi:two-component system phosphate regulon sensor histidine kinase PhoR
MAETLQDGALEDPEVSDRFLKTIIRETDRLARIAEDLLILSNAESTTPIKEPFDLSLLLSEVVERHRPQAFDRALGLRLTAPASIQIHGARDQIEQVFANLVDNAIKYTPPSERIEVTAETLGDSVRVQVQDTGLGMLQEHLPRIFERFYRVDKARSRESGGTGLGLAIVKNIVEAHGGQVSVQSEFNHGTTFTVVLPRDTKD